MHTSLQYANLLWHENLSRFLSWSAIATKNQFYFFFVFQYHVTEPLSDRSFLKLLSLSGHF